MKAALESIFVLLFSLPSFIEEAPSANLYLQSGLISVENISYQISHQIVSKYWQLLLE
jgi:hypothetical protein